MLTTQMYIDCRFDSLDMYLNVLSIRKIQLWMAKEVYNSRLALFHQQIL